MHIQSPPVVFIFLFPQLNPVLQFFMVYPVFVSQIESSSLGHKQTRMDYKRLWQLSHFSSFLKPASSLLLLSLTCHNTAALPHVVSPTPLPLFVPYLWFMPHVPVCLRLSSVIRILCALGRGIPNPVCKTSFSEWTCLCCNEPHVNKLPFKVVVLFIYGIMLQQVTRQKGALPCTGTLCIRDAGSRGAEGGCSTPSWRGARAAKQHEFTTWTFHFVQFPTTQ